MIEPWSQTTSGVAFDLLTPRAQDVRIEDVASHLAKIGRYSGATLGSIAYCVAQHSVLVADILRMWGYGPEIQREGLLHDAPETYYGDTTAPVQAAIRIIFNEMVERLTAPTVRAAGHDLGPLPFRPLARSPLDELHARVDLVVREALGLPAEESAIVKRADLVALAIERKFLMAPCERDWKLPEAADLRWASLPVWYANDGRDQFLERLREIDEQIAEQNTKGEA